MSESEPKYSSNDIVLAKISGYKPWPSIVCPEDKLPQNILLKKPKYKNHSKKSYPVYFLADGTFSWCNDNQLTKFDDKQVENFHQNEAKLKGVYKQSFELAITFPTCDEVLPVYVPEPEPQAEPIPDLKLSKNGSKKRKAPARAATATANKKKKQSLNSTTASPAPVGNKRKKAAIIIESSSDEAEAELEFEEEESEEEEEEESEEEEEQELQQSFIPDIYSKDIHETIKKSSKQLMNLRLELQTKLLMPDFLNDDSTPLQDKTEAYINFLQKPSLSSQLSNILDSILNISSNVNNFILLKKHNIFKILYLSSCKPELSNFPKLKNQILDILIKFDFEKEEIGVIDENWSCSFDDVEAEPEQEPEPEQEAVDQQQTTTTNGDSVKLESLSNEQMKSLPEAEPKPEPEPELKPEPIVVD